MGSTVDTSIEVAHLLCVPRTLLPACVIICLLHLCLLGPQPALLRDCLPPSLPPSLQGGVPASA